MRLRLLVPRRGRRGRLGCVAVALLAGCGGGGDERRDGDETYEDKGITLLVDRESLPYVSGSTIDFVDGLQGAGFKVENPNVVAACGCGSSFRVAEEEEVSAV